MTPIHYYGLALRRSEIKKPRLSAEEKSLILLNEWLSPSQYEQFKTNGYFDVIGSHTKRRYRIDKYFYSFNIYELSYKEKVIRKLCILPDPGIAHHLGDRLLTQKLLFENNEKEALSIANIDDIILPFIARLLSFLHLY